MSAPRKVSVYESENDLGKPGSVGQIAAVRWLDEQNNPRWYIVVIVGQTDEGYEVLWNDEIYRVDVERDELVLQYNRNLTTFFQRHPDATSITMGKDVYLFGNPTEHTIDTCLSAVNTVRARTARPPINITGASGELSLSGMAAMVPDNKIIFD